MDELRGKTVLVTGGAVRVGRALAIGLAQAGMRVALHYGGSAQAAEATAGEIRALGGEVAVFQADFRVAYPAAVELVQAAAARFGQVDVLINNAAIFEAATLVETSAEQYDRHLEINLKAAFFAAQAFVGQLPEGAEGQILNINDWRVARPHGTHLAYELSKAGLDALTRALAVDLAPRVRVNQIALGAILPPPEAAPDYFEKKARRIPLRRTGSPEDVVQAALYLLSAGFVTGETVVVTGGEHL